MSISDNDNKQKVQYSQQPNTVKRALEIYEKFIEIPKNMKRKLASRLTDRNPSSSDHDCQTHKRLKPSSESTAKDDLKCFDKSPVSNKLKKTESTDSITSSTSFDQSQTSEKPWNTLVSNNEGFRSSDNSTVGSHNLNNEELPTGSVDKYGKCSKCLRNPKNGTIIHDNGEAHVCYCYNCSKKIYKQKKPCPSCKRSIKKVLLLEVYP